MARKTTSLTGGAYRLVQGSFLSPFFHSILRSHQLPHTLLFSLSGDSDGIYLVSKWLVEVVQAAAGLDSGNEQHRSQDTFPRGLLVVAQGGTCAPSPAHFCIRH